MCNNKIYVIMKQNLFLILCAALIFVACIDEKKKRVTGTTGKVTEVISGNTLKLHNGLKVQLLGIGEDEKHAKKYIEQHIVGKNVRLIADSKDTKQTYKNTRREWVRAYVSEGREHRSLNGFLIRNGFAEFSPGMVADSLSNFTQEEEPDRPLPPEQLRTKIMPATFLIATNKGSGTGFFINENGLALTNNHVLNYDNVEGARVYLFGMDGRVSEDNYRYIDRIVYTKYDGKHDFTIFYVKNDNGEKNRCLSLAKMETKEGSSIAKLGCPLGLPANFSTGNLSTYYNGFFAHSIPVNHGDSGGPVVDMCGRAIGVNQSIEFNPTLKEQAKGIAYAVDIRLIRAYLDELNYQYAGR